MLGEGSEDIWASEDTFPAKTRLGAKARGRLKRLLERTALAKTLQRVKPCASQKTLADDRSGEGTHHREDTWVCEDTCRRQPGRENRRHVGVRRHCPKRRPVGVRRHCPKTGLAKTRGVAKTHERAKPIPADRSGEDKTSVVAKAHGSAKTLPEDQYTRVREDTWAGKDSFRRQVGQRHVVMKT